MCVITVQSLSVSGGKVSEVIVPIHHPVLGVIDESRRAVFKWVSANTVRPV